jgi:hypothetical protein
MSLNMDLDDLLAESMDLVQQRKNAKQAVKSAVKGKPVEQPKINTGWMTKDEMEAHAADIKRFKDKGERWKSLGAVLLCYAQLCSHCGSEHKTIEGVFVRKFSEKQRCTALFKPGGAIEYANLSREVEIRTSQVSMCANCYPEQGWDGAEINII